MQTWPDAPHTAAAAVAAAGSMSQSSKKTWALLPPSSRATRFSRAAAGGLDPPAGLDRPGEPDGVDVGMGDQAGADHLAGAVEHVEDAGRDAGLGHS